MDAAALKNSWEMVAKLGDEAPLFFYSHLFLSHPELRPMFPVAMGAQRDKLFGALGRIVSNVDDLPRVSPFIEQLGRDHRRFSVVTAHYEYVGSSLLATLRHFLAAGWTEELASQWAAAYGHIARVMVEAAEESEDTAPAWWDARVLASERRTMDVAVLQIRPEQSYSYLPGQSFAVEIPQRPRLWRYLTPANAPREDGSIELHVQRVDGGQVSGQLLRAVRPGDTIRMGAPVGERLTLGQDDRRDLLMVAGATGLAPLTAVLEQVDREWQSQGVSRNIHLFHGVRAPWDLYDRERLKQLADSRPWFRYTEVVSEDPTYPGVRGLVGTAAASAGPWHGRLAMVCGGPAMVGHTVTELRRAGMPADDIGYEEFGEISVDETAREETGERG